MMTFIFIMIVYKYNTLSVSTTVKVNGIYLQLNWEELILNDVLMRPSGVNSDAILVKF